MKITLGICLCTVMGGAAPVPKDAAPQPYYGKIAVKEMRMLPAYHVLQMPFDDAMSRRAWTNLVTQYDFNRMVFLKGDLEAFSRMETKIDDALKSGDVSFGYEVHRTFLRRLADRVAFVTNMLAEADFDFSTDETYEWRRKDADWPATRAEQDDLWRRRIKNEILAQVLGRELDAEKAKREADKADGTVRERDGGDGDDEPREPVLSPRENLVKRYRQYLEAFSEPDEENVLQRYLSAAAQAYDPHTDYMSPARKEDFDMEMNLSLCGVGAVLSMDEGALKIQEVMPGGPMARDGRIRKGDKIIGVGQGDGPVEDVLYKPMRKSIRKIRGPKGTKVVLEILPRTDPTGATRKRIALIRDEIKMEEQAATGRVERIVLNGVTNVFGYVRLPGFYATMDRRPSDPGYRTCSLDVAKYLAEFNACETDGMILDLRGNGGGSLREAVLITQLFTRETPVVQIREAGKIYALPTFSDQPAFAYRRPMLVMVDRASASASEIVAGALQDLGRAVVVGDTQTHGKGTVQTVLTLGRETYGSMKITTARFYRINGKSTQVRGVASDLVLPSTLDGLDVGEDKLPNALPFSRVEPARFAPVWNAQSYVADLRRLSEARRGASPEWKRHLHAVRLFHELSERRALPLEREARLKLMREERAVREFADPDGDGDVEDGEDAEDAAYAQSECPDKRRDLVLDESWRVLSDLVQLARGRGGVPDDGDSRPARQSLWIRLLGGE